MSVLPADMVLESIRTGLMDDFLDDVVSAVSRRQDLLKAEVANSLSVGDVVTLTERISPKLLAGKRVRIESFEGSKIHAVLVDYAGRNWQYGKKLSFKANLLGHKVS